jgi:hypothetical protein
VDLTELMVETSAQYFSECEHQKQPNQDSTNAILGNVQTGCINTVDPTTSHTHGQSIPEKVVFNDGTAAGVLANLIGCTRTTILHEADVSLKCSGLMLPSPSDITPTRVDPFRSTLMTLHEKPGQFMRILKKEKIAVNGSKLNIFVCSLIR